jgi:hypothetical protein
VTQAHLTLKEAAEACRVSLSTIQRRQGEFANAYQDGTGTWRVPISDLLGAGLKLRPSAPDDVSQGHDPARNGAYPARNGTDLAQLLVCIEPLTAGLAAERTARQVAQARAAA